MLGREGVRGGIWRQSYHCYPSVLHVAGNWCASLMGRLQARRADWFYTDQLHFGPLGFDRECDAGEQATTTNWNHHGVEAGYLR